MSLKTAVAPTRITVTSDSTSYSLDDGTSGGGGKVSGAAILVKNGTATLTVNAVNDNTGATVINGGTLQINGHIGSGNITNYGELIFSQTASRSVPGTLTGPGNLTQSGSATLSLLANNDTFSGGVTISGGATLQVGSGGAAGTLGTGSTVTNDGTLILNRSGTFSFSKVIQGSGAFTKSGSSVVTLTASNSYSGATTVNDGKLILATAAAHAGKGALIVQAAGTNDLNGNDMTVTRMVNANPSTTTGGRVVNNAGSATNVLTINYDGTGTADSSMTIADNDGSGGKIRVVKVGTGTQMLRGANTYSGGTTIEAGALQARSANNALGTGPIYLNGGTLDNYSSTLTNPVITLTNSGLYSAGNCYFNGTLTGTNDLTVTEAGTVTSGETISWATAGQLTNYSGKFTCIVDGTTYSRTWRWAHAANGMNGSATAAWDLEGNVGMTALNTGYTILLGSLEGGTNTSVNGNNTTYIVGARNASTLYSGNVYGTGTFVKTGTGTLTLDSQYTFFGATVVSNATLAFTNAANPTNSSSIRLLPGTVLDIRGMGIMITETNESGEVTNSYVQATSTLQLSGNTTNQTLTGSGLIRGSVVASANSTINPGDTIGTLTVETNVTLGGTLVLELNRTNGLATNDLLVAKSITGGGTLLVTNLGPALYSGDTFKLFSQAVSGFASISLPQTFVQSGSTNTYTWANNLAVDGSIRVVSGYNPVDPTPTNITCTFDGTNLTLSWPENHRGWTLLTNAVDVGNSSFWFPYPGSTSATNVVITPNAGAGQVFFKMVLY